VRSLLKWTDENRDINVEPAASYVEPTFNDSTAPANRRASETSQTSRTSYRSRPVEHRDEHVHDRGTGRSAADGGALASSARELAQQNATPSATARKVRPVAALQAPSMVNSMLQARMVPDTDRLVKAVLRDLEKTYGDVDISRAEILDMFRTVVCARTNLDRRDVRLLENREIDIIELRADGTIEEIVERLADPAGILPNVRGQLEDIVGADLKEHFLNDAYLRREIYGSSIRHSPPPEYFDSEEWHLRLQKLRTDIQSMQSNLTALARKVHRQFRRNTSPHFPVITEKSLGRDKILAALRTEPSLATYAERLATYDADRRTFDILWQDANKLVLRLVKMAYDEASSADREAASASGYVRPTGNGDGSEEFHRVYWSLPLAEPRGGSIYDELRERIDPEARLPRFLQEHYGKELRENPIFKDNPIEAAVLNLAVIKIANINPKLSLLTKAGDAITVEKQLDAAWQQCRADAYRRADPKHVIAAAKIGYFASELQRIVEPFLQQHLQARHGDELDRNPVLNAVTDEKEIIRRAMVKCVAKDPMYSVPVELDEIDLRLEEAWHEVRAEAYGTVSSERVEQAQRAGYKAGVVDMHLLAYMVRDHGTEIMKNPVFGPRVTGNAIIMRTYLHLASKAPDFSVNKENEAAFMRDVEEAWRKIRYEVYRLASDTQLSDASKAGFRKP